MIPSMDLAAGDNSDVSYFEITGCNGNQYEYRGAKAEDVLFTPDVFPMEKAKIGMEILTTIRLPWQSVN